MLELGRAWQASLARLREVLDRLDTIADVDSPAFKNTSEAAVAEDEVATRLRRRIVRIPAHTWAGIQLKIDVAAWCAENESGPDDDEFADVLRRDTDATNVAVFWSLTRDLAAWTKRPVADAELITLGAQFEASWQAEAAAWTAYREARSKRGLDRWEAAYDVTKSVVDKIEKLPATTLPGLLVKVRACSWTHAGEPFDVDFFTEQNTTDNRLAAAILRDLLRLDGRPLPQQGRKHPDEGVPAMASEADLVTA